MNDRTVLEAYGTLVEPTSVKIQRLLPGTPERVWAYLTESELRRQWLASGEMDLTPDASFELVWRNDELTDPPGERPEGAAEEHRMECRIVEVEPPRKLVFTWGTGSEVTWALEPAGAHVLLTVIHRRLADRAALLNVSSGWHAHLDVLVAHAEGRKAAPFWDACARLRKEYDRRLPA
jgi:uncharacterized protein YndB with AHSA1/START domain